MNPVNPVWNHETHITMFQQHWHKWCWQGTFHVIMLHHQCDEPSTGSAVTVVHINIALGNGQCIGDAKIPNRMVVGQAWTVVWWPTEQSIQVFRPIRPTLCVDLSGHDVRDVKVMSCGASRIIGHSCDKHYGPYGMVIDWHDRVMRFDNHSRIRLVPAFACNMLTTSKLVRPWSVKS